MSAAVGGALGRSGRGGRRRTRLRSPTGSGLGRPPSRVVATLCRRNFPSPFPRRHPPRRRFGGTGRDFRFRAGGAGLVGSVGGGAAKGRHFRLGPRVSPERRYLLRLLSLLPAETPAPVSDWGCGPGAPGSPGAGGLALACRSPQDAPPSPPERQCFTAGPEAGGSPISSPLQDHSRELPPWTPPGTGRGHRRVFIRNGPLQCQGPPRIPSPPPRRLPPGEPAPASSIALLTGQLLPSPPPHLL